MKRLTFGLPRMHKEPGEKRDFLPELAGVISRAGHQVVIEEGVGSGMGLTEADYTRFAPDLRVVKTREEAWSQDVVLVLRSPEVEEFEELIKKGSTIIAMLHLPTRPRRVKKLQELGAHAISLDSLEDDDGLRSVENTRAVGWNGLEAAFGALEKWAPERLAKDQSVFRVTIMGAGQVGKHAAEAAIKYGNRDRWSEWSKRRVPPASANIIGRRIVADHALLKEQLANTDVLVDATQRDKSEVPLIPNEALDWLPKHAVVADLVVDPYVPTGTPPTVRSIEGIPLGTLDQYTYLPDDPNWSKTIPSGVRTQSRRPVVSCYSWPGIHPRECMEHYGRQLEPLLTRLLERGGGGKLDKHGDAIDRALWRGSLAGFVEQRG
ncbi:MAG: hypothetical protein DI536_29955 [Archangium gephyra]|uniref:Alanine dehydrogenase/pyridine nucleotide transhydrogenase N-terminal domain-containing protein n=1 Tax=Archangium gephyra TaxID=48 RepID=A0A2W5UTH7_9BACT|nr:MAG: hypothetical protein DI536_29955 [Archangium gephyra]